MRLLISTGEVSGDLQGSLLIKSLRGEAVRRGFDLEILALGGRRMERAGAELISDTSSIGAIGFWEALPYVLPTLRAQSLLDKVLKERLPDVVILIDYMGPNIRLGNKIKNLSTHIPIIYYIAPQEWAWRVGDGGTTDLIGFTDKILAIFKGEAKFYSSKGGNVSWVGHPMLDTLKELPERKSAFDRLGIDPRRKVLLLLPASRTQELRYLMPTLLEAASLLQSHDPSVYVVIPAGLESFEEPLTKALNSYGVDGKIIPAKKTDELKPFIFGCASLAIGKSGTINMELALNCVPQIVGYKISRITAFVLRKFLKFHVDHISPVNLMMNQRLVPELVQNDFTPESIVELAIPLLEDPLVRSRMIDGYMKFKHQLGEVGVTDRAAREILDIGSK